MSARIVRRPSAVEDLIEIYVHIGARNASAAERFLDSVESALNRLSEMPEMARSWQSENPRLAEVRIWHLTDFREYVILYQPLLNGIEVLRVVHGVRNISELLEDESDR